MNELASKAFQQEVRYPVGSVIVKEKKMQGFYTEAGLQGTGSGVGGMIKREKGYDEANGDWEYFYFENPNAIQSGKIKSCVQCHKNAAESDFVFDWFQVTDDK